MRQRQLHPLLIAFLILFVLTQTAQAQDKQYHWDALDVDITVLPNSDIRVVETQAYVFTRGSFHSAFRQIPMDRIESITDVSVSEDGTQYRRGSEDPATFTTSHRDGDFRITWYYPYTSNATRIFAIAYTVKGGLRFYDGGDQLWWKAIFSDRDFAVRSSQVTVHLPPGISRESLVVASYGATARHQVVDGSTVTFNALDISPGHELEVRVQFPHGIVQGQPPSWQTAADRMLNYNERDRSTVNLALTVVGLLIPIVGALGLYLLWYSKGRNMPTGVVADYLAEPPSDLPPGLVGTLIDEKVDLKDIVASIADLGRRGVIQISEEEEPALLGISTERDYVLKRLQPTDPLRPYERALLTGLFQGGENRIRLSGLKDEFYKEIPEITNLMYHEVVRQDLFPSNPRETRMRYRRLAIGLFILGIVLAKGAMILFAEYSDTAFCPGLGLSLIAVVTMAASHYMSQKTQAGTEAAASWLAFRRYLDNIEKYTNLAEVKDIFDKYLPYAIAFGLEREWATKFARVGTPGPAWYHPNRPVIANDDSSGGGAVGDSLPDPGRMGGWAASLQTSSDGVMDSLQSTSNSLFSMLDSASRTLFSPPAGSGDGGDFSGGGDSGGGGGGGGGGGAD